MDSLKDIVGRTRWITFDCYGTLIDWRGGIRGVLRRVLEDGGAAERVHLEEVLAAHVATEAAVEAGAYRPYRRVLAETLVRLAARFNFPLLPQHRDLLAESLPSWSPFADTGAALVRLKQRFKLGVLSNIDRDLFAQTARHFPVAFDLVITAEDVQAYKPSHAHFLHGLAELGADRDGLLHVAESAFHDGGPTSQLGIPWVWINRTAGTNRHGALPVGEFRDLAGFVAAIS